MCDFSAVRGLMIALGIIVGFAVTSAIFAIGWARGGGLPLVTTISFAAVSSWAVSAMILLAVTMGAIRGFCGCAGRVALCAALCASLTPMLITLGVALLALAATSAYMAADWTGLNVGMVVAFSAALGLTAVMMGFLAVWVDRLRRCGG